MAGGADPFFGSETVSVCERFVLFLFCELFFLSCQLANIKTHQRAQIEQAATRRNSPHSSCVGQKMSILDLKDHFSRDPVQVQSLQLKRRGDISINGRRPWPRALQDSRSSTKGKEASHRAFAKNVNQKQCCPRVLVVVRKQTTS